MENSPIGIFDSGIGGLTVVKEIINLLPNENIIYLGDTARVPYGIRGKKVITEFSLELTHHLLSQKVKFLVVACNTISATCLDRIQDISPVPILGVIAPAVKKIINTSRTQKVGIIGTPATINSNIYEREIKKLAPSFNISSKACPLFVPIVEEGLAGSDIASLTAKYYLKDLRDIDILHLGCTHYPLLRNVIQETIGDDVTIIDSASPTAEELRKILIENDLLNTQSNQGNHAFYVTDTPTRAMTISEAFLGKDIKASIQKVDIIFS